MFSPMRSQLAKEHQAPRPSNTRVVGLNSVKTDKYNIVSNYTLLADGVYCDFDPIKKKADIGSNFPERE